MNFLHPSFLWALLFLAIPIIVHLFNLRRYQKEFFTNTSLLKTFLNETKKTSMLKKRFLLACRLFALFFLILAFVQPFFSSKNRKNGLIQMSIYLDNSSSMELPSEDKTALLDAKKKAKKLIHSLQNKATYHIIANDFGSRQLQMLSYQEAIDAVDDIQLTSQTRNLEEIWTKQWRILSNSGNEPREFFWISDFQKSQIPVFKKELTNTINCIPIIHRKKRNVYIDTAYIQSPNIKLNQNISIIYRVKKSEDDEASSSLVTCTQNDQIKGYKEIKWNQQNEITDTFILKIVTTDWQFVKLSVSDPSLSFDNEYLFCIYLSPPPQVTIVSNAAENKFISNALKADDNFEVKTVAPEKMTMDLIQKSPLIVFNQLENPSESLTSMTLEMLRSNKNIVLFLPSNALNASYLKFFEATGISSITELDESPSKIRSLNTQDALLSGILLSMDKKLDLPMTKAYYISGSYSARSKEVLISLDNSNPFLLKYSRLGEGNVYLFTSLIHPDKSNFVYSSIFAPIIYKLGAIASHSNVYSYFINFKTQINLPIENQNTDQVYRLVNEGTQLIPPQRHVGKSLTISIDGIPLEAGFYKVQNNKNETLRNIALNRTRDESEMKFYSANELRDLFGDNLKIESDLLPHSKHSESIAEYDLWKLCIGLCLFFILLELSTLFFWDKLSNSFRK